MKMIETWEISRCLYIGEDFSDAIKSFYLHFLKQPFYAKSSVKVKDPITITVNQAKGIISIKAEVECED